MSADLLRQAAAKIHETAQAAYPGPWRWDENYGNPDDTGLALTNDAKDEVIGAYNYHCCDFRDDPTVRDQEKAHIALWSPDVAEPVAALLDKAARRWDGMRATATDAQIEGVLRVEYALARRVLGESS